MPLSVSNEATVTGNPQDDDFFASSETDHPQHPQAQNQQAQDAAALLYLQMSDSAVGIAAEYQDESQDDMDMEDMDEDRPLLSSVEPLTPPACTATHTHTTAHTTAPLLAKTAKNNTGHAPPTVTTRASNSNSNSVVRSRKTGGTTDSALYKRQGRRKRKRPPGKNNGKNNGSTSTGKLHSFQPCLFADPCLKLCRNHHHHHPCMTQIQSSWICMAVLARVLLWCTTAALAGAVFWLSYELLNHGYVLILILILILKLCNCETVYIYI
jgi:hypothetical protein